jgi:2-polyprenyl-6-methoxyphenol hydroxylase-like FAD-dependent oxidoreductase
MLAEYGQATQWSTELLDVRHDGEGANAAVICTLRHADGSTEEVRSKYLVACDGKNSRVRRQLQLIQDESDYRGSVMQNLDVFLENFPDSDDWVHYCAGRTHFVMIVKLPGGFYLLLLSDRGEASAADVTPEQGFMNVVNQHFDGVRLGKVVGIEMGKLGAPGPYLSRPQCIPCWGFCPCALDHGWTGHELPAGCLEPGLEAGHGIARRGGSFAAGQL